MYDIREQMKEGFHICPLQVFQLLTTGYNSSTSIDAFQRLSNTVASDIMIRQSTRVPRIYTSNGRVVDVYHHNTPMELSREQIQLLDSLFV